MSGLKACDGIEWTEGLEEVWELLNNIVGCLDKGDVIMGGKPLELVELDGKIIPDEFSFFTRVDAAHAYLDAVKHAEL